MRATSFSFLNYGVRAKLTAAFMVAAIGALSLLVYLNGLYAQSALTHEAKRALEVAATRTADNLNLFLDHSLNSIESEAQNPIIGDFLLKLAPESELSHQRITTIRLLRFLRTRSKWFTSYALLDKQGKVVLDTQTLNIGNSEINQLYFHIPFVQKTTNNQASFYLGAPIYENGYFNKVIGVLRIKYNADILQEIIADQNDLLGQGAFAVLIDQ